MLGVVLHAAEPFISFIVTTMPHHAHYQGQFNTSELSENLIGLLMACVHVFRMPAFFLLAGYFMALLWEQRGPKATVENRFKRIYLPFIVCILISGFLTQSSLPELWHLWFLYTLIFLIPIASILAWLSKQLRFRSDLLFIWLKKCFENTVGCVLLFAGINFLLLTFLNLQEVPILLSWAPTQETLIYYLVYLLLGWSLYAAKVDLTRTSRHAGKLVGIGVTLTVIYESQKLLSHSSQLDDVVLVNVLHGSALICLTRGLMGLFLRWVPTLSPGWRYASDASYWVYIFHLPIAYHLPRLWMGSEQPALLLYLANVTLTLVICFTTYDLFVRSTFIGRFLNGRRYERGPLIWRASGACSAVLCLGFSFQFAAAQAPIIQKQKAEAEAKEWEAWEALGGPASILPFFDALNKKIPRLGGEESGPVCMPSGRYAICHHPRTYQEAKIGCTSLGASLVVVDSEEEKSHIGTIWSAFKLGFDSSYWIGLNKLTENGRWLWVDGTPVDYTAWDSGQPSNNPDETCVATSLASRNAWYGYPCDTEIMFLCEFTPPPTQEASTAFRRRLIHPMI